MATIGTEFCSGASDTSVDERRLQEELIEVVERARLAGELGCGSGMSGALPLVRLDARLACAARVLARDMAATGAHSLNDSAGRGTTDRLRLAGYEPRYWAEGYAWDVADADDALQAMLKDSDFCAGFANAALNEVGVGLSGTTFVVTLAAE